MNYSDLDLKYDAVSIFPVNNSCVFVASNNEDYLQSLKKYFSNKVKTARFSAAYKAGNWDGYIRFLQNNGVLPRGLLKECIKVLQEWEIKVDLRDGVLKENYDVSDFKQVINDTLIVAQPEDKKLIPWQHQWDCAEALVENREAIVKAATSAGKSYIITMTTTYLLEKGLARNVLLVVPRTDLVIQMEKDAIEYGFNRDDIGVYFGRDKDYQGKRYVISTWQSLQNIEDREFFEQWDALFIDEVHGAKSNSKKSKKDRKTIGNNLRQICDLCSNAQWRFGCTGTLPSEALDVRTVISGLGPVVHEVTAAELMRKGHITEIDINVMILNYDKKKFNQHRKQYYLNEGITKETKKEDIPKTIGFNCEKEYIENYIPRLKVIVKIAKFRLQKNENVLILANTLNFGENIVKTLKFLCKDEVNEVFYISGAMNEKKRKEIREFMEKNERVVVVATTSLFSTGISVKRLHSVILANMGKSKTVVLQSLGRAMRQHSSKLRAKIYDLCDNLKYNFVHAKERMQFYADEEFDVKIQEIEI